MVINASGWFPPHLQQLQNKSKDKFTLNMPKVLSVGHMQFKKRNAFSKNHCTSNIHLLPVAVAESDDWSFQTHIFSKTFNCTSLLMS